MGSNLLYQGKVKTVEALDDERVKITFTNKITAGDGAKKDNIPGKGKMNLDLTEMLFSIAEKAGVPHHTLSRESDTEVIARKLEIFPIEVVVRNVIAGSYARRYGIEDGTDLDQPIVEYFLKDDDLHDPPIDGEVAISRGFVNRSQLSLLRTRALQVNEALRSIFLKAGMLLVDFKLEFGTDKNGDIYLGDELSGDCMRVWDVDTREKFDKDRFRKDLGDVLTGYQAIIDRLEKIEYEVEPVPVVADIAIAPKEGVTNPAGEVTKRAVVNSGLLGIGQVIVGKSISILVEEPIGNDWLHKLDETTTNLLTNPLVEQFSITYRLA